MFVFSKTTAPTVRSTKADYKKSERPWRPSQDPLPPTALLFFVCVCVCVWMRWMFKKKKRKKKKMIVCVGREGVGLCASCFPRGGKRNVCMLRVALIWRLQRAAALGFVVSADVVRRAQCIVGKENLWPYEHGWLRAQPCCTHTRTHAHTQWNEWDFTFSVLNCLDGFYGLNGSWRMGRKKRGEERKERRTGRERRWQSPRENEVQRKK